MKHFRKASKEGFIKQFFFNKLWGNLYQIVEKNLKEAMIVLNEFLVEFLKEFSEIFAQTVSERIIKRFVNCHFYCIFKVLEKILDFLYK